MEREHLHRERIEQSLGQRIEVGRRSECLRMRRGHVGIVIRREMIEHCPVPRMEEGRNKGREACRMVVDAKRRGQACGT
jgi:hypothetical protein